MGSKKRLYHSLRLCLIRGGMKRAQYVRDRGIYNHIGKNVLIMPRKIPLYPELIRIHDNVHIASKVSFITHDVVHTMLNRKYNTHEFQEKIGCIEIMENVFVGSNSIIMYDVKIGKNTIIAAGSIVTKDIPENSIVAGIPARVIGHFSDYVEKLSNKQMPYPKNLKPKGQYINEELVEIMWHSFTHRTK